MKAQITFHLTVSRPLRWADAGGVHWRSQRPRRHHGHAEEDDGPDARVNHHRGGPRGLRAPRPAKTLIISNYNSNQPPSKRERLDHWRSPGRRLMCCCQSETLCDGLWLVVQPPGVPSLRSSSQVEKQTRFWQRCLNTLMILFSSSDLHPPTRSTVTSHPRMFKLSFTLNFVVIPVCFQMCPRLHTFHYLLTSVCVSDRAARFSDSSSLLLLWFHF